LRKCFNFLVISLLVISICYSFIPSKITWAATNPLITTTTYQSTEGRSYWQSSDLREWLNSNAAVGKVGYTDTTPSYSGEAGFLNGFTANEQNGIAVANHRAYISGIDSEVKTGGTASYSSGWSTPDSNSLTASQGDLLSTLDSVYYQSVNDKVYLLNLGEAYKFVQKRGLSLIRDLTPQAQTKTGNYAKSVDWWFNAPLSPQAGMETNYYTDGDGTANTNANGKYGVVPVINLKPTTLVSGTTANNLNVGQTVTYGHYLGQPIEWQVINITNGYPMLLATHVLDIKELDANGTQTHEYSNYINFPTADINLISETMSPTGSISDTTAPVLTVTNSSDMFSRQNGSYTLKFSATDDSSGVAYTVLPNGSKTTATSFSYTITANQDYVFKTVDKAGNYRVLTLPITNINPPSNVQITPSATGWTNKPVNVNIYATNSAGISGYSGTQGGRDNSFYTFPNYTSYSGKQIEISGTVSLTKATASTSGIYANAGLSFMSLNSDQTEYNLSHNWDVFKSISLSTLQTNGAQSFDMTVDVPSNYNSNLQAWLQLSITSGNSNYAVKWSNLSYKLISTDDFGVKSITLPSGQVINSPTYMDTLSNSGTYTYQVLDSRGVTTSKSITVQIDTTSPSLSVSGNPTTIVHALPTLTATGTDADSGVKQIETPDGIWHSGDSASYTVPGNGTYNFVVQDNAGNQTTKSVTVSNVGSLLYFDPPATTTATTVLKSDQTKLDLSGTDFQLEDNRGTGAGWNLTVQAGQLESTSGKLLPQGTLQMCAPGISGSDSTPTSPISGYQSIDTDSPVSVVSAAQNTGEGQYNISLANNMRLNIPASAFAGTYKTTITWQLESAP
jgi:hypothetical protein